MYQVGRRTIAETVGYKNIRGEIREYYSGISPLSFYGQGIC